MQRFPAKYCGITCLCSPNVPMSLCDHCNIPASARILTAFYSHPCPSSPFHRPSSPHHHSLSPYPHHMFCHPQCILTGLEQESGADCHKTVKNSDLPASAAFCDYVPLYLSGTFIPTASRFRRRITVSGRQSWRGSCAPLHLLVADSKFQMSVPLLLTLVESPHGTIYVGPSPPRRTGASDRAVMRHK